VYKFQTSRGPDRDAEGVEGEGNGGVPLPADWESGGKHRKLPQWGPGLCPGRKRVWESFSA